MRQIRRGIQRRRFAEQLGGEQARAAIGITDGTLRISVGLESATDLVDDLRSALG